MILTKEIDVNDFKEMFKGSIVENNFNEAQYSLLFNVNLNP